MSNVQKAVEFIETSLLKPLLIQDDITDISFNGENLFYQSSRFGRKMASIAISYEEAYQLIKHLANLMNIPFTYSDAIVDMSIQRYRIFAVGPAITRKEFQGSISFSIRIHDPIGHFTFKFLLDNHPFKRLFTFLLKQRQSMIIAGITGSGKTQLQKELLMLIPPFQRILILDNILELDGLNIPHVDITLWQVDNPSQFPAMIEGALRSHPDWLLIAEARGKEFKEVVQSVRTGHPIITTLHSERLSSIPDRMTNMLLIDESLDHMVTIKEEVSKLFPVLIYVKSQTDAQGIHRFISEVTVFHHNMIYTFDIRSCVADIEAFFQAW